MDEQEAHTLASCIEVHLKARRLDGYSDKTLYSYELHLRCLALDLNGEITVEAILSTCVPTSRA